MTSYKGILKTSSSVAKTSEPKHVVFRTVLVREYPFILGDNPAVRSGAPLTIDWDYEAEETYDIDMYEYMRKGKRRHRKKLVLNVRKRAKLLNELGYDLGQIAMVTMTILEIKDQRRESARDSQGLGAFFSSGMNFGDLISGAAEATGGGLLKMNDVLKSGSVGVVGGAIGAVTSVASETGKMSLRATSAATNAVASTGKATTDAVTGVVVGTGTLIRRSGAKLGRLLNLQGKHQTDKKRIVAAEAASRARANQINSDQNAKGRLVEEKISAMVAAMDEDVVRSIMDSAEFSTDFSDSDDDMDDARAMVTGATLDSTVKRRPPNPSLPNAKPPRPVQQ